MRNQFIGPEAPPDQVSKKNAIPRVEIVAARSRQQSIVRLVVLGLMRQSRLKRWIATRHEIAECSWTRNKGQQPNAVIEWSYVEWFW